MADDPNPPSRGRRVLTGSPGFWRRFLPQTALGLAGLLFMMSIAAASSGTVLYAYYSVKLNKTEKQVHDVKTQIKDDLKSAQQLLEEDKNQALDEIGQQLDELEKFSASGATLADLLQKVSKSIFFVSTRDENGQPSVGTAFVVFSDSEQSYLLTSYTTIRANTATPAPPLEMRQGDRTLTVTLKSWDENNDLALLTTATPNLPPLKWAGGNPPVATGDRVFAVSGLGVAGGAVSQGFVADVSSSGIQHDAPIGAAFQGGPLTNSKGEVIGVSSRTFSPLHFAPGAVYFAVPIRNACQQVLQCPS